MHRVTTFKRIDPKANLERAMCMSKIFSDAIDKEHDILRTRLDKNELVEACETYLKTPKHELYYSADEQLVLQNVFLNTKNAIDAYTRSFLNVGADHFPQISNIEYEINVRKGPSITKIRQLCDSLKLSISAETVKAKANNAQENMQTTSRFTYTSTEEITRKGCLLL